MKKLRYPALFIAFVGVFLFGFYCSQRMAAKDETALGQHILYYVDPMNPSNEHGRPFCGYAR